VQQTGDGLIIIALFAPNTIADRQSLAPFSKIRVLRPRDLAKDAVASADAAAYLWGVVHDVDVSQLAMDEAAGHAAAFFSNPLLSDDNLNEVGRRGHAKPIKVLP
jgi:hypothetical protein